MDLIQISKTIGDKIAEATSWLIVQVSTIGINVTATGAKALNLLIFSVLLYLLIKVINLSKKPLQYIIIMFLIILILSTITSFFT